PCLAQAAQLDQHTRPEIGRPWRRTGAMFGKTSRPITTLMLHNVPRMYTQEQLLKEIEHASGNKVGFNFLYLPWDSRLGRNVGYGFLNCCDAEGAEWCRAFFSEYYFCKSAKRKPCAISPAHIQGVESNLIHLVDTLVGEGGKSAPIILWQGQSVRFPQVVATLRQLLGTPARLPGPSGSAVQQPALEGLEARRPQPASAPGASGRPPAAAQSPPPSRSIRVAGSAEALGSGSRGRAAGGGSDSDEHEDASCLRAEFSLARRLGALMLERRAALLRAAPAAGPSTAPSPAEPAGGGGAPPRVPAGFRRPPGLELPQRPVPVGGAAAGGGSPARTPPLAAVGRPTVTESAKDLHSLASEKFFDTWSSDSGWLAGGVDGASVEKSPGVSGRLVATLDFGSLKVFSL
ncbi:unnamed protein product, partial [Prorocentrum cordatum]